MGDLVKTLGSFIQKLSDENYAQSLAFYRFWFGVGQTYHRIPSDQILDIVWDNRLTSSSLIDPGRGKLIHSTAHLIVCFAGDVESDSTPGSPGLQSHLCTRTLREFFDSNLLVAWHKDHNWGSIDTTNFCADANLIAHWANIGCVEEAAIRDHILQSLISYPKLYDHQADALIILFKLAGPTFEAYTDRSVVDRCFELLKDHYSSGAKAELVKVCVPHVVEDSHWAKTNLQEVVGLRERFWEGLPPPPVMNPGPADADLTVTPVITSQALPNRGLAPQVLHPPLLEPVVIPEGNTSPESSTPHSPSISVATMSDFTVGDTSDDEPLFDPTVITPHDTLYFQDGNVEILCGNTLFRVHTSVLSLHSLVLGRMLVTANLATAESPSGCPRILSSDTATDFATLLKVIYLPAYAAILVCQSIVPLTTYVYRFLERNKVPDFTTFSSLLRITAKYEMPSIRSQMLNVVRDAYPETFEGLVPSKPLGESVFSGPTPHPNEVLNLFAQQNITSVLPVAYYMAVRRGPDSLMDRRLPASARLSPEILQVAIKGLLALREMEVKEAHRLVFGSKGSRTCSLSSCPSRNITGPRISEAHQKVIDRIADSTYSGTKLLQALSLREVRGGDRLGFCGSCVEGWEAGHVDVRRKAWAALPDVFGLKG